MESLNKGGNSRDLLANVVRSNAIVSRDDEEVDADLFPKMSLMQTMERHLREMN